MPCVAGNVPVDIVAWPAQVTVLRYGIGRLDEACALERQPLEASRPVWTVAVDVVAAHLVDADEDDQSRRLVGAERDLDWTASRPASRPATSTERGVMERSQG